MSSASGYCSLSQERLASHTMDLQLSAAALVLGNSALKSGASQTVYPGTVCRLALKLSA